MSDAMLVILVLGAVTYALKAAGPLLLGNRELPPVMDRLIAALPAALLGGLVAVSVAVEAQRYVLDARLAGLGAAALVLWRGGGFIPTVAAAAIVTATARLFA